MAKTVLDIANGISELTATRPTDRRPANGLISSADLIGVFDGQLYRFDGAEHPVPLALMELLYRQPYETIPDAKVFPLFLHDVRTTRNGLSGVVRLPLTEIIECGQVIAWGPPLRRVRVDLDGWEEWLCSHGVFVGPARYVGLCGIKAWLAHVNFRLYCAQINETRAIKYHKAYGGELRQLAALTPDISRMPAFRDYAADIELTGGKKRNPGDHAGNKESQRAIIELAALAGAIRRRAGLRSWPAAFEAACKARPGWVLSNWKEPVSALEKGIARLKNTRWANPHKWGI